MAVIDYVFDFETLGKAPKGAVVDCSVICFKHDPEIVPTFEELVNSAKRFKFDLESQKGFRNFDKSTLKFWREKPAEARKELLPDKDNDITLQQFWKEFPEYLRRQGFNPQVGMGWCRGQSFDFPVMTNIIEQVTGEEETFRFEPCRYWNQRDIRTRIEALLLVRGMVDCPLPKGTLTGFVKHNSVHDCAKAVLELIYALRYATGLETPPAREDMEIIY